MIFNLIGGVLLTACGGTMIADALSSNEKEEWAKSANDESRQRYGVDFGELDNNLQKSIASETGRRIIGINCSVGVSITASIEEIDVGFYNTHPRSASRPFQWCATMKGTLTSQAFTRLRPLRRGINKNIIAEFKQDILEQFISFPEKSSILISDDCHPGTFMDHNYRFPVLNDISPREKSALKFAPIQVYHL